MIASKVIINYLRAGQMKIVLMIYNIHPDIAPVLHLWSLSSSSRRYHHCQLGTISPKNTLLLLPDTPSAADPKSTLIAHQMNQKPSS